MRDKEVLLVSDFVGVGKVALSMQIPVLSAIGTSINYLPTGMVSNNFDYGDAYLEDLTGFMEKSLEVWKKLDFQFDIISTGILLNLRQVELVEELIGYQKERPLIISDPIMGDNGKLYTGLDPSLAEASLAMAKIADLVIPNLTELSLILGEDYPKEVTYDLVEDWLAKARDLGINSIVVTSVKIGDKHYNYGYQDCGEFIKVEYKNVDYNTAGTGDIFSSLIIGHLQKNISLEEAIEVSSGIITSIVDQEHLVVRKRPVNEVPIQHYLQEIYEKMK